MKRIGNKPVQLARSASRRGKTPSRFQFDITIDKIHGVKPGGTYTVKWTRGVKVATTRPVTAPKDASVKSGLAVDQKLSLLVTLFRSDPSQKFDAKDTKLSLISHNARKQERTAAKIHFDLSQFAGVPSSTTPKLFKLSEKFSVRVVVDSRFTKSGSGGPGSAGASSAMSGMSGVSGRSSEEDDDDADDFDDLCLDDVPEPEVMSATLKNTRSKVVAKAVSPKVPTTADSAGKAVLSAPEKRRSSMMLTPPSPQAINGAGAIVLEKRRSGSGASPKVIEKRKSSGVGSSPKRGVSPLAMFKRSLGAEEVVAAESKEKVGKLEEDNERLKAQIREVEQEKRRLMEGNNDVVKRLQAEVDAQRRELADVKGLRASTDKNIGELEGHKRELESTARQLKMELDNLKKGNVALEAKTKSLELKNRDLGSEVDRLAVVVSNKSSAGEGGGNEEVERRIAKLREEKEAVEGKLKAHESHSSKVRTTYQQLSHMYNELRDQNAALQSELDETGAKAGRQSVTEADEKEEASVLLGAARQEVRDVEASKEALQSDYDRMLVQVSSLQDRLENTSQMLEDSQRETEELHTETDELKGQRDMAMQRALSRGKSNTGGDSSGSRSLGIGRVEEELRIATEKYEREQTRQTRKIVELEQEVADLREDLDYEKGEKLKAREERDKVRENVRELERRTSQAAKKDDAMHSLRRQLSTVQMREQDHEMMIEDLRTERNRLQAEVDGLAASVADRRSSNADELGEVLRDLVSTKLALAQAEDDKLNLQFSMKKLKKSEKAIQQKLASHASRLEVKLGQANEELEKLQGGTRLENASEFNELGSDVDY